MLITVNECTIYYIKFVGNDLHALLVLTAALCFDLCAAIAEASVIVENIYGKPPLALPQIMVLWSCSCL